MSTKQDWSNTAANNATADSGINWQEGQARSTVNDSARMMMKRDADWLDDIGGVYTTAGTANAQTVTVASAYTAYNTGLRVLVKAGALLTNTGDTTLSLNSIGAKKVYKDGSVLVGGEIVAGGEYEFCYDAALNAAAGGWHLLNGKEAASVTAPVGAQYVTLATDATLTNERTLAGESTVVSVTDGGAGNAVTVGLATAGVTNAKLANMADATIKGRALSAGAGVPTDLTITQVLDMVTGAAQGDILYRDAAAWNNLPAGTAGQELLSGGAGANPSWGTVVDTKVYSAAGTTAWSKPTGATMVLVHLVGGGGGGGAGRRGTAGGRRLGGGGGGGGGHTQFLIPAALLGSSENVVVGGGGGGATGQTVNATNGASGSAGTATTFATVYSAAGGTVGQGGTAATGSGGNAGTSVGVHMGGQGGGDGSDTGTPAAPSTTGFGSAGGGGGGGGGIDAANVSRDGGPGGIWSTVYSTGITAPSGGTTAGTKNGTTSTVTFDVVGAGGGGGAAGVATTGGNGGNGVRGGGGGGGGASVDGQVSGAGGTGGDGYAVIISYK